MQEIGMLGRVWKVKAGGKQKERKRSQKRKKRAGKDTEEKGVRTDKREVQSEDEKASGSGMKEIEGFGKPGHLCRHHQMPSRHEVVQSSYRKARE